MPHEEGHKETEAEKNLRLAKEITEKTAAKKPKQEAQVARERQKDIIESEDRLKWLAEKRAEAAEKRDESKMNVWQTLGSFGTGGILGEAAGWHEKERAAQTEYEQTLKDLSGERGSLAADAAKSSRTRNGISNAAAGVRDNKINTTISRFGQLSPTAQQKALAGVGFTTAQAPTSFRHPDDVAAGESGVHTTETQYTGPKGNVFTDPKKAVRSVIAAERIKGTKKKQWAIQQQEAAQAASDFGAAVGAGEKADQKVQAAIDEEARYEQLRGRRKTEQEEQYNWAQGKGDQEKYNIFLGESAYNAGRAGTPYDKWAANMTALNNDKPLPDKDDTFRQEFYRGEKAGQATTEGDRRTVVASIGRSGGVISDYKDRLKWAFDDDGSLKEPYREAYNGAFTVYEGTVKANKKVSRTVTKATDRVRRKKWSKANEATLSGLTSGGPSRMGLDAKTPSDLGSATQLRPVALKPKDGWERSNDGTITLTKQGGDLLYGGRDEKLLSKVAEIKRLTGELPPLTSAPDINRLHARAIAEAQTEAKGLVAESLHRNIHRGENAWQKSMDYINRKVGIEDDRGLSTIAISILQSQRAAEALKDSPSSNADALAQWNIAMDGHSPPAGTGDTGVVPTANIDGVNQPKWAIIVDYNFKRTDGIIVPLVVFANNPFLSEKLSHREEKMRDLQVAIKQKEVNKAAGVQGGVTERINDETYEVIPNNPSGDPRPSVQELIQGRPRDR